MSGRRVSPLSSRARELLARERTVTGDEALKARVLDRARLALEGGKQVKVGSKALERWPTPARARHAWRTLLVIAAALGAAGLAAAQLGALVMRGDRTAPAVIPTTPVKATAPVKTTAMPAAQPDPTAAPDVSVPVSPRESHPAAPPADSSRSAARQFASEVELLEPARSSIAQRDYAAALVLLAKHQHEFPNGELAQEREALRVRALWGAGQRSAAKAAAKAFGKRYPTSALLSWMKDESDAP